MQIGHFNALGVDAEGVGTVLVGLEVQWHFASGFGINNGVVLAVLRDVDIGILLAEIKLAQLGTFVEAHDGVVDGLAVGAATGGHSLSQSDVQTAVVGVLLVGGCGAESDGLTSIDFHDNTIVRRNGSRDGLCIGQND